MVAELVLIVVVVRELVLLADLRRNAAGDAADVPVVDAGLRRVRRVAKRRGVQVGEAVGDRLVHAPVAERGVEPELVPHDRPAERRVEVPDVLDLADVRQLVVRVVGEVAPEVLCVQARPMPGELQLSDAKLRWRSCQNDAAERVAAVLGHHVDAHAALAHFGRVGAGHIADFLEAAVVPVHAAVGALGAQVVQAQAFDGLDRVARAAVLQRRLLEVARAADVARQRAAAADRERGAGNHDADGLDVPAGRNRVHAPRAS